MRNHRDRLCIMAKMLEIAKGGTLKTPIMYKANLNSAQLDEYLSLLLEMGFSKPSTRVRKPSTKQLRMASTTFKPTRNSRL